MKLSPQLIYEKLKEQFPITSKGELSNYGILDRPLLYTADQTPEAGRTYLIPSHLADTVKNTSSASVLYIFVYEQELPVQTAYMDGLYIADTQSFGSVFNCLQDIFSYYNNWEQELLNIAMQRGSMYSMLLASYDIFKNPIFIQGMDFSIVASVGNEELPEDYPNIYNGSNSIDYINAFKQDALYNSVREKDGPFIFPSHITGSRSLNINIKRYEKTTHRLKVIENTTPLSEGMEVLITLLAGFIDHALQHNAMHRTGKNRSLHSIFLSILSDKTADYMNISQQLSTQSWHTGHKYMCVVLQITYLDQNNLTINAICNYIENVFPASCAFQFKEDIVIFFNMTKLDMTEDEVSNKLIYFIRDSFLKAGYSRIMKGHLNLRRQYVQACLALEVGNQESPYAWSHSFNDIALPYILLQACKRLPGYMICHEKLLTLREMDETQNTEYMKTLRVYLDNHLNAVQASKELFIHRSTFLYRLEKIKNILEIDLNDNDDLLYLMLSFRFIDKESEKGGDFPS